MLDGGGFGGAGDPPFGRGRVMAGVAVVFGMCALSFAAGCVLTAVMLRREQPPEPAAQPAPVAAPMSLFEPRFPPDDYATRPIHRNPVMSIPIARPAPEHLRPTPRPNLVVVPDPVPCDRKPARQDEVRRMHVVRAEPIAEPAGAADEAGAVERVERADAPGPAVPTAESVGPGVEPARLAGPGTETSETTEPSESGEAAGSGPEPGVVHAVPQREPVVLRRAVEAARRESNR